MSSAGLEYKQGQDYVEKSYWQNWVDNPGKTFEHTHPALIYAVFWIFGFIIMVVATFIYKPWKQRPRRGKHKGWVGRKNVGYRAEKNNEDRLHIVWDIDENKVKQLINRAGFEGEDPGANQSTSQDDVDTGRLDKIYPAYGWSQGIEYYSVTHAKWLQAVVDVSASNTSTGPQARYETSIAGTSQRRHGVSPALLRYPLAASDPCEVYWREEKRWVSATVVERRTTGQIVLYKVSLTEPEDGPLPQGWVEGVDEDNHGSTYYYNESLQQTQWTRPVGALEVAASLVRRRFTTGEFVEAYLGPDKGWVPASVCPGEQQPIEEAEAEDHGFTPKSAKSGKSGVSASQVGVAVYWSKVPIQPQAQEGGVQLQMKTIPSYYLRSLGSPEVRAIKLEDANNAQTPTSSVGGMPGARSVEIQNPTALSSAVDQYLAGGLLSGGRRSAPPPPAVWADMGMVDSEHSCIV